jgi:hypothetical protein
MATKSRAKDRARKAKRQAAARNAGAVTDEDAAPAKAKAKAETATTTKSGRSKGRTTSGRATPPRSGRHTPPVSKSVRTSPRWMGLVIVASFVLGALVVILDYADLLPGGVNNAWLLAAIGAIFVGLLLATRYH